LHEIVLDSRQQFWLQIALHSFVYTPYVSIHYYLCFL
jgi:hypothetical protein